VIARDERRWAVACHLGALAVFLGIPFGNVLAPLGIWLAYRHESRLIASQALESLDFQLTVLVAALGCAALMLLAIGIPLLVALAVADVWFVVQAAMHVHRGERYRYRYALHFTSGGLGS